MNFSLTDDQADVMSGLDQMLAGIATDEGRGSAATSYYSARLAKALGESGFLSIAMEEGFGPLEAAVIVERVAREPDVVEIAASALVAPLLPGSLDLKPIALVGLGRTTARFLPVARLAVIDRGDHALLLPLEPGAIPAIETLLAYPYGRLPDGVLQKAERFENVISVRRRWRIGLAAEAAGCMAAALAAVIDHVTNRFAFGRPLGTFQAIQHRLAMASETAESTRWLALRAAWSDEEEDAASAAGFAQMRIASFTYDLHQFCGAMGLTLEFPLHLWTYRLRALAGELGGASAQTQALVQARWGR